MKYEVDEPVLEVQAPSCVFFLGNSFDLVANL
jgi:hypothetical protein